MMCFFKRFNFWFRMAVLVLLSVAGLGLNTVAARADLKVCNDTENTAGVAIGHRDPSGWVTEGWWRIVADQCATVLEGELSSRYFYIYAEDAQTGSQWGGSVFMCTSAREFRVEGLKDCFARGYERSGFFEIDTGNQANWQIRLSETTHTKTDKKVEK